MSDHPTTWKIKDGGVYSSGFALDSRHHGCIMQPRSLVYICPECDGEPWGWIKVGKMPWVAQHVPCEAHGGGGIIPPDMENYKDIPPKILKREIILWSKAYPKRLRYVY